MEKTLEIHLQEQREKIATEILHFPVVFTEEASSEQRKIFYAFLEYMSAWVRANGSHR